MDRRSIDLARVAVCGDAEPLFRMSREVAPDITRENTFAVVSRRRARAMARGRTLVIDNYDSYAVILSHLIARVEGAAPVVVKNDDVSVDAVRATLLGGDEGFARVVIGPGPGTPTRASDVGAAVAILRAEGARADVPVFGVCLGHQALATFADGGATEKNPAGAVHGRVCGVRHDGGSALFEGVPSGSANGFVATRYHSLAVTACGAGYRARAWAEDDGTIMALEHERLPRYGVQFHPESVCTTYGDRIYANFLAASEAWWTSKTGEPPSGVSVPRALVDASARLECAPSTSGPSSVLGDPSHLRLRVKTVDASATPSTRITEDIFWRLFGGAAGDSDAVASDCFWLDTADESKGRFSFMGARGGPLWRRALFDLAPAPRDAMTADADGTRRFGAASSRRRAPGVLRVENARGDVTTETLERGFVAWLDDHLRRRTVRAKDAASLPFDFRCGFVGYLGYEMRDECDSLPPATDSPLPDAAFFLCDRYVAFDHLERVVYVVGAHDEDDDEASSVTTEWVASIAASIDEIVAGASAVGASSVDGANETVHAMTSDELMRATDFAWRRDREEYVADIRACQDAIACGETYETCLTNLLHRRRSADSRASPRALYTELRRRNPAPYAAFLSVGTGTRRADTDTDTAAGPSPIVVTCSSPERFLRRDRSGALEAKPIKGTCARVSPLGCDADVAAALALERDVKERAENLMIVDLLRNDLARVCDVGSVDVPALAKIESYASAHQLVSRVTGTPRADVSSADVLRAVFPPGSMTGAPKIRTMDIIEALENAPRMVYSGSIGYFDFDGAFDVNVVIRTATTRGDDQWIGAGGAITVLSDPVKEWEEIELKARAILRAFASVERERSE